MNEAKQATPHSDLIEQLMDSRVPKTEREHAAAREIEMLREALRLPAALDAPQPEPVAWMWKDGTITSDPDRADGTWQPLYTRPQPAASGFVDSKMNPIKREWVGLTDEEIDSIYLNHHNQFGECISGDWGYEREIEAKLREKNNA